MQLLRLHSTICLHPPPQMAVLNHICCFGEHEVVVSHILLDVAQPRGAGTFTFTVQAENIKEVYYMLWT